MTLIFRTPSKRCPFRRFNDQPVEVIQLSSRVKTRYRGQLHLFHVRFPNGEYGVALSDELFIVP